jgi:hypothetical protein
MIRLERSISRVASAVVVGMRVYGEALAWGRENDKRDSKYLG